MTERMHRRASRLELEDALEFVEASRDILREP